MTVGRRGGFPRWFVILAALSLALAFAAPLAHAQNEGGDNNNDQSGKTNSYVLSPTTYKRIQQVQKLLADESYSKAISQAKDMLGVAKREGDYAEALVNQLIAQGYLLEKNYDAAEPYLERVIQINALQPQAEISVVYELATIYLTQKKYDDSIRLYRQVMAQDAQANKKPNPDLYYRIGLAYSFEKSYQEAYDNIGKAIGLADKPQKDWYQNWFIVAYKLKNYGKANDIAKRLVANWPEEKDFWNYYANTYLLLHEDSHAASVYALMHDRGMLKTKDEYTQLASLYQAEHAPYKAGELLAEGMDKGIIPKTASDYDLLAGVWMQAREWDKALAALGEEAALTSNGDIYLRQASIYLNQMKYPQAVQAARNAIQKGGLKDTGQAWMILGEAAFSLKDWDTALDAFHHAENYQSQAKNAQGWVKYVLVTRGHGKDSDDD